MSFLNLQGVSVTLTAVRYPPCVCGASYGHHRPPDRECQGYRPTEPITQLGTRAYTPRLSLPLGRRIVCLILWGVERRLQRWREHYDAR